MIITRIDIEHPHLAKYYTKKYYNKLYGTKLRSLKKLRAYERQMFKRTLIEMSTAEIYPMDPPSGKIYYMPFGIEYKEKINI